AGSPALATLGASRAKPDPSIKTKRSKRSGGRIAVRWNAKLAKGDRVRLIERGPGGIVRTITTSRKRAGNVTFRPAPGPKGKRSIPASILRGRSVALERSAGSFTLKRDVRPAGARRLKVQRKGT